ncbi:MAG: molybdopterin converting factor subunit 1 [Limnohabitans sp.]|nr:molybdopterin converting factor subunit 1 [Limnohabitans sp.]
MKITVRYFASIRETLGVGSEVVETDASTVAQLREQLMLRSPLHAQALAIDRVIRVAVNQKMVSVDHPLAQASEVAFFPPVTGG